MFSFLFAKQIGKTHTVAQQCLAEMLGTAGLVFCGTGAIAINEVTGGAVSHVGVAISFGLVVCAMIYAFGAISGAHINPAVSIAFVLAKQLDKKLLLPYLISQMAGAVMASFTLKMLFPTSEFLGATLPLQGDFMQSFVLETILTFWLMLVILLVANGNTNQQNLAGMVIGGVVLLEAMFAGPICGASMNPARSFAPAIASGHLEHLWVYLSAPIIGACLAVGVYQLLKNK